METRRLLTRFLKPLCVTIQSAGKGHEVPGRKLGNETHDLPEKDAVGCVHLCSSRAANGPEMPFHPLYLSV